MQLGRPRQRARAGHRCRRAPHELRSSAVRGPTRATTRLRAVLRREQSPKGERIPMSVRAFRRGLVHAARALPARTQSSFLSLHGRLSSRAQGMRRPRISVEPRSDSPPQNLADLPGLYARNATLPGGRCTCSVVDHETTVVWQCGRGHGRSHGLRNPLGTAGDIGANVSEAPLLGPNDQARPYPDHSRLEG